MSERLSRCMARILRHEAVSLGLEMSEGGYVDVDELLEVPEISHFTVDDVSDVVSRDAKGRFKLRKRLEKLEITATQGHSIKIAEPEMEVINHYTDIRDQVLHGTKMSNWPEIKLLGLSRMRRTHIHFAQGQNPRSGFPPNCDIAIELDVKKTLQSGIKLYRSDNGVILSPGNIHGRIPPNCFKKVFNIFTREIIQ